MEVLVTAVVVGVIHTAMAKDPRIMADRLARELEAKGFREGVDAFAHGLERLLATLRRDILRIPAIADSDSDRSRTAFR